jgi:hypothetical protein
MLRTFVILLMVVLLAGCSGAVGGGTGGGSANKAVAEKFVTAFNAADMNGVLDTVTDDFLITPLGGGTPWKGKDSLRQLLAADFPLGVQIGVDKWSEEGATVKADATLTSPKPNAFQPTPVTYLWTIDNGKISDLKITRR